MAALERTGVELMIEIKLIEKFQYGHVRFFPACDISHEIVKLTGRKTFYESDIEVLKRVGFHITWVIGIGVRV